MTCDVLHVSCVVRVTCNHNGHHLLNPSIYQQLPAKPSRKPDEYVGVSGLEFRGLGLEFQCMDIRGLGFRFSVSCWGIRGYGLGVTL